MSKLTVMGFDPSFRNFGMAKGFLDVDTGEFSLARIHLSEIETPAKSKVVRQNSLDLQVAQRSHKALHGFLEDVDMVFVEIPVGSQSARAMASYGICVGIIASIQKPLIQVTPTEVKMVTGSKTASKADMINWATTEYPQAPWLTKTQKGVTSFINKNEHMADAIAAIHAGCQTDQFKQARALMIN